MKIIQEWRGLLSPWIIRGIHFNATFTISEFRTVATRIGLMGERGILVDFPYCRLDFSVFCNIFQVSYLPSSRSECCFGTNLLREWRFYTMANSIRIYALGYASRLRVTERLSKLIKSFFTRTSGRSSPLIHSPSLVI